jgi:hypothetical protein
MRHLAGRLGWPTIAPGEALGAKKLPVGGGESWWQGAIRALCLAHQRRDDGHVFRRLS